MKTKLFVLIIMAMGLLSGCEDTAHKNYLMAAESVLANLRGGHVVDKYHYGFYLDQWKYAIEQDIPTESFLKDMGNAFEKDGGKKVADDSHESVVKAMSALPTPIGRDERLNSKIMELYGAYLKYRSNAEKPSGSYNSYRADHDRMETDFTTLMAQVDVLIKQ